MGPARTGSNAAARTIKVERKRIVNYESDWGEGEVGKSLGKRLRLIHDLVIPFIQVHVLQRVIQLVISALVFVLVLVVLVVLSLSTITQSPD